MASADTPDPPMPMKCRSVGVSDGCSPHFIFVAGALVLRKRTALRCETGGTAIAVGADNDANDIEADGI